MLITSHRHRPEDLRLWAELEAADLAHYEVGKVEAKKIAAIDSIRQFSREGRCYASVSWGKDSVTLAHLVALSGEPIGLVHVKAVPHGNPENAAARDAFRDQFGLPLYSEVAADYRGIVGGPDEIEREKDKVFFAAFRPFGGRYLSGIRANESAGRKIRMRRWGLASINALAPLGWWTEADIFAYLAHHELPVHPSYAMLGSGRWERRQIRVDELGGCRGDQFGRADWEREYYGDVLRRIESSRSERG